MTQMFGMVWYGTASEVHCNLWLCANYKFNQNYWHVFVIKYISLLLPSQ